MESARSGDERALLALLAAAQPDIRRYARRSCNNSADAEDAVQETLWLLYRKVGTLRAISSLSGWLFMVVRRECIRFGRRLMGSSSSTDVVDIDTLKDDERLAHLPLNELSTDLARAIHSLPEHYREVVLLRDIEEMTIDEIAQTLSLTRESTKARLHRARAMLREYLLQE